GQGLRAFLATMWPAVALSIGAGILVAAVNLPALPAALPLLLLWLASPLAACWVSQPLVVRQPVLGKEEVRELRRIARRTWDFFETFTGPEDHWLPPDNFQEAPREELAHRTSPTNMGLLMLSTLAAHDLGYLSVSSLAQRLEDTLGTLE